MEENVLLKNFGTLRVGGPARFFCTVENLADLKEAVGFAKEKKLPLLTIGGGSNMYFSDDGFPGLIIRNQMLGMEFGDEDEKGNAVVSVGAGENWDGFVAETVRRNLGGIENLSWIPGTVGASPVQNIGAYGTEVKETIHEVEALDTRTLVVKKFSNEACNFSYRNSFFKTEEGKHFVVTRVLFRLQKNAPINTNYKDVRAYFEAEKNDHPTLADVRQAVITIRKNKLPDPAVLGTLGSFFKNPILSESAFAQLQKTYAEMPFYTVEQGYKVPAAWLIDHVCGMRGYRKGDVGTYPKQPLAIVNYGEGSAADVRNFSEEVRACVKDKTAVELEYEVRFF